MIEVFLFLSVSSIASLIGLWAVAMLGGCLYKRFLLGAKGWEQVPCLSLYRDFGNLSADGCDFVCRSRPRTVVEYVSIVSSIITVCSSAAQVLTSDLSFVLLLFFPFSVSPALVCSQKEPTFGAASDSEDEKDDNLLPM